MNTLELWRTLWSRQSLKPAFAVFVFIACTGAFHASGLATFAFAFIYAAALPAFAKDFRFMFRKPGTVALILAFPLVCLASTFWSIDPLVTLRHAIQLLFTAFLGIWIGTVLSLRAVYFSLAAALSMCILASLLNVIVGFTPAFSQGEYVDAARFFTGIYDQKNPMGYVIYLAALCLLCSGLELCKTWLFAILVLGMLPLLLLTDSTTSIALYLFTITLPLVYFAMNLTAPRVLLLSLLVSALSAIFLLTAMLDVSLLDAGLKLAGKDTKLSGRTQIWQAASQQYNQVPVLGVGYQVFWTSSWFSSEVATIRGSVLDSIDNFHNAYIEALVGTGLVGTLCLVTALTMLLVSSISQMAGKIPPTTLATLYIGVLIGIRAMVEASLYFQHQLDYLILSTLLTALAVRGSQAVADKQPKRQRPSNRYRRRIPHAGKRAVARP